MDMVAQAESTTEVRAPLNRQRVLEAGIALADSQGLEALSMRKLGHALGVEAMSLYNHVKNKDDLFDGMVEVLVSGIELIETGDDWKSTMRQQLLAARAQMLAHKWAPAVMETRTALGPALLLYFNHFAGIFRSGGFSYDLLHHAMHVLGSRALGFSQELFEPDDPSEADEAAMEVFAQMADQLPFLGEMMGEIMHDSPDDTIGWCDDQTEFIFAIELILDGLEVKRLAEAG